MSKNNKGKVNRRKFLKMLMNDLSILKEKQKRIRKNMLDTVGFRYMKKVSGMEPILC